MTSISASDRTIALPDPADSRERLALACALRAVDALNIAIMGLLWIIAIILVDPRGEFPMVDDWAYVVPVRSLVEEGRIVFSGFTAPNLISQVWWGALFGWLFGVSFETMRAATLTIGFVGIVGMYGLLRIVPARPAAALFGALCLMFNPLYFCLSFTFMSDVFYTAMQTVAFALLLYGLLSTSPVASSFGWLAAVAALLCRQIALVIPVTLAVARIQQRGWSWSSPLLAIAPILAFVLIQRGYESWLVDTGKLPVMFNYNSELIRERLASPFGFIFAQAGNTIVYLFFYVGLFTLPFTLYLAQSEFQTLPERWRRSAWIAVFACAYASNTLILATEGPMPLWPHIFSPWGFGAELTGPPKAEGYQYILTSVASLGGSLGMLLLGLRLWVHVSADRSGPAATLRLVGFLSAVILFVPVMFMVLRFDRYFLPMLPGLLLFAFARPAAAAPLPSFRSLGAVSAVATLAMMALFSITTTNDYLRLMRARVAAQDIALAQPGIDRLDVDAGWLLNGWRHFGLTGNPRTVETWHNDPKIVVDFSQRRGYTVIAEVPVRRAVLWARGVEFRVLVQRRLPGVGELIGPIEEKPDRTPVDPWDRANHFYPSTVPRPQP